LVEDDLARFIAPFVDKEGRSMPLLEELVGSKFVLPFSAARNEFRTDFSADPRRFVIINASGDRSGSRGDESSRLLNIENDADFDGIFLLGTSSTNEA
jgi:hypothetical protein